MSGIRFVLTVVLSGPLAEGRDELLKEARGVRVWLLTDVVDHREARVVNTELGQKARHAAGMRNTFDSGSIFPQ